jgi:integrase/recombinase XerD
MFKTQGTLTEVVTSNDYLLTWLEGFLISRKAEGMAEGTICFYQKKLAKFIQYCDSRAVTQISQLTPDDLRGFILLLEVEGHNPGGLHAFYRTVKTFLRWYELEDEPENWKNPIAKVKAPRVPQEILPAIELGDVVKLLGVCAGGYFGARDKAIFLVLIDTGVRASELTGLDMSDLDIARGRLFIRLGKGGKDRYVFIGRETRRAIRRWLKYREDERGPLFSNRYNERLGYDGLRAIVTRRSRLAGIQPPSLHSFRRGFTLAAWRSGVDVLSISRLLGHSSLQVLGRYLDQTGSDLQGAHAKIKF